MPKYVIDVYIITVVVAVIETTKIRFTQSCFRTNNMDMYAGGTSKKSDFLDLF